MHRTQPPRADHAFMPFVWKNKYIYTGLNALTTDISYLTILYIPMEPKLINQSPKIGANMNPTLPVPNLCTLNSSRRTMMETSTTASADKKRKKGWEIRHTYPFYQINEKICLVSKPMKKKVKCGRYNNEIEHGISNLCRILELDPGDH